MAANIVIVRDPNGNVLHFYYAPPGSSTFTEISIPTGILGVARRPDKAVYRKRHYLVGCVSRPLVFIEDNATLLPAGIAAPTAAPVIATGAAGVVTGNVIGYVTFRHKVGGVLVHESNLSSPSSTVAFVNQQVSWSSIPTTSPDTRVTHVGLYRSVDGALPRLATEVTLGTATTTENVATGALGAVGPTNNGVPPYARFIAIYHNRAWYAGGTDPERVYYSEIDQPEAVGTNSYIPLLDGEACTSIRRVRDQLCSPGRNVFYDIQGYTADDFVMRKVHPTTGCVSHFAALNIDERLFFPAVDGVWLYDGASFTYLMEDIRTFWKDDFCPNITAFNDCVAVEDRELHVYKLLVIKSTTPRSFYYVGHYLNIEQGKPVRWSFDKRARVDTALGTLDDGEGCYSSFAGSCDGYLRQENIDSNADDDGDTYAKALTIQSKHDFFEDIGGGDSKVVNGMDLYVRSESNPWTVKLYAGEEDAAEALSPSQSFSLPATAASLGSQTYVGQNKTELRPTQVAGDGLTVKIEASSPLRMEYRGFGGYWKMGHPTRARKT